MCVGRRGPRPLPSQGHRIDGRDMGAGCADIPLLPILQVTGTHSAFVLI